MGDSEFGKCDVCGTEASIARQYYHYDVKCECCGGGTHFEYTKYCVNCTPKPPRTIKAMIKPLD